MWATSYTLWIVFKQQQQQKIHHTFLEFPSVVYPTVVVPAPVAWELALFLRGAELPQTEVALSSTLLHLNRYSC